MNKTVTQIVEEIEKEGARFDSIAAQADELCEEKWVESPVEKRKYVDWSMMAICTALGIVGAMGHIRWPT